MVTRGWVCIHVCMINNDPWNASPSTDAWIRAYPWLVSQPHGSHGWIVINPRVDTGVSMARFATTWLPWMDNYKPPRGYGRIHALRVDDFLFGAPFVVLGKYGVATNDSGLLGTQPTGDVAHQEKSPCCHANTTHPCAGSASGQ